MNRLTPLQKGLLLTALHLLLVSSLGGVLLLDRARLPRVWVKTMPYDPDLPIRGRYASLQLEIMIPGGIQLTDEERKQREDAQKGTYHWTPTFYRNVDLKTENGKLIVVVSEQGRHAVQVREPVEGQEQFMLTEPVVFFLPEHVLDPTFRKRGEELWVEVTVPPKGPPRPIQLAVKKDGQFTPLGLQ